ncbi:hypothetical protein XENOCAPTIV_017499 [Xenoophorus captivus]|uniref:P-type ATPase C-terminal domain-containing protein n=1 Tax=Xenoophorus captivus TaxID=1517983 RepID=A0ABV0Q4K1_9TELE
MLKKAGALFQRKSKRNYSLSEDPVIDSTKTKSSRDPNRLQTCSLHALSQNDIFTAQSEDLCYEAESPDEAALVYAARAYGFILLARTPNSVTVRLPSGEELVFEVLDTLTFDSNRKRMSVLVRHPVTKEYVLYTKGADYAIMELLGTPYAGATGIEDRLQENVPDTIVALREAGIHVWVLTGDKPETAVNIGYACRLLEDEDLVINMSCQNKVRRLQLTCTSILDCTLEEVRRYGEDPRNVGTTLNISLVIDGNTLAMAMSPDLQERFVDLAKQCRSVLCCRVTPLQKSRVVKLVRKKLKVMTLAVGDGANDVNMIQAADIGIGISGQEGMQAVMASDFAISRFKHLKRLLLVHGHWCYTRLANMVIYFFYKNVAYQDSDVDIFTFGTPLNTVALFTILLHLAIEIKSWVSTELICVAWTNQSMYTFHVLKNSVAPSPLLQGRQLDRMEPSTRDQWIKEWRGFRGGPLVKRYELSDPPSPTRATPVDFFTESLTDADFMGDDNSLNVITDNHHRAVQYDDNLFTKL